MKKLNFSVIIILFAAFSLINFCCGHYDYDEVKDKLDKNKAEFDKLAKNFLNQEACASFLRRDFSKERSFLPYSGDTYLVYGVTPLVDLKTYEIIIPKQFEKKEEKFWEKDFKDIKGNNYDNLETFLNKYLIPRTFFDEYKNFIGKNELHGIERDRNFNYVIIRFGFVDGLIYQPDEGVVPKQPLAKEIKKIDNNWYYFREW